MLNTILIFLGLFTTIVVGLMIVGLVVRLFSPSKIKRTNKCSSEHTFCYLTRAKKNKAEQVLNFFLAIRIYQCMYCKKKYVRVAPLFKKKKSRTS